MGARPYDPDTLAQRWGVSATSIRNRCRAGDLPHFRLGRLYRIPANVVEEIEGCQTSNLAGSEEAGASTGAPRTGNELVISLSPAASKRQGRRQ